VDRQSVYKALADDTRFALYAELVASAEPLSTSELAGRLKLHANTVRPHLERMREVGLLEVESDHNGSVGRPQHRYRPAPGAPGVDIDPPAYLALSGLLAQVAAAGRPDPEAVANEVGRGEGRRMAAADAKRGSGARPRQRGCVEVVRAAMTRLGFDPVLEPTGEGATMTFTHCPVREVAEAHPELACNLHRGIVEALAELAGGEVAAFATLADPRPCRAELAVG